MKIESHNSQIKRTVAKTIEVIFQKDNEIPDFLKKILLKRVLWVATEHEDDESFKKYHGKPYWSIGAINQVLENIKSNKKLFHNLRHEHAVPKKVIIDKILELPEVDEKSVFKILDSWGHAVIVSKAEDKILNNHGLRSKMPDTIPLDSKIDIVFARYRKAGIRVCDVRGKDISKLTIEDIINLERNSMV
jgi:hypothetical protein